MVRVSGFKIWVGKGVLVVVDDVTWLLSNVSPSMQLRKVRNLVAMRLWRASKPEGVLWAIQSDG